MMAEKLPLSTIDYLARLARLELSQKEKELYAKQLSLILDYIIKLNEVETSGIMPTSGGVVELKNKMRDDIATESEVMNEGLLFVSPMREDNYFKVIGVFKEK